MNCKNCESPISPEDHYCRECVAEIVNERLTGNGIWQKLADQFFGWDNKYLLTILTLLRKPETVLNAYIGGTRKKYVAPFTFLAIGTAIAMITFNQFSDSYMEVIDMFYESEYELIESQFEKELDKEQLRLEKEAQIEQSRKIQQWILKYFNFLTFILIPIYAWISRLVFG